MRHRFSRIREIQVMRFSTEVMSTTIPVNKTS
jgi:hypothetical protein